MVTGKCFHNELKRTVDYTIGGDMVYRCVSKDCYEIFAVRAIDFPEEKIAGSVRERNANGASGRYNPGLTFDQTTTRVAIGKVATRFWRKYKVCRIGYVDTVAFNGA